MILPKEKQLACLELSKHMKELGCPQDSVWWWVKTSKGFILYDKSYKDTCLKYWRNIEYYSAYTVAEVMEDIKKFFSIDSKFKIVYKEIFKTWQIWEFESSKLICIADTFVNLLAKMWIWLRENKYI